MGVAYNTSLVRDNLSLYLDARSYKPKYGHLKYRWFTKSTTSNPANKTEFDALFAGTPQGTGIHKGDVDWLTFAARPSYITPSEGFTWEVTGSLIAPESGNYVYNTVSDDSNELQINGQVITSYYGGRGITAGDTSANVNLSAGLHTIQYRSEQGNGGAGAQINWKKPSSSFFETIPAGNFVIGLNNNIWPDLSNSDNDGVTTNVTYSNTAVVFNGTSSSVTVPNTSGFGSVSTVPACTVSMWVNLTRKSGSPTGNVLYQYIAGFRNDSNCSFYFLLIDGGGATVTTEGRVQTAAGTFDLNVDFTNYFNKWTNIAFVANGTRSDLYLDGVLVGSKTGISGSFGSTTSNFTIGASPGNLYFTNGSISAVTFHRAALTAAQVQQNFNALRGRYGI